MAASGATPIILYHSTTGAAVPSNTNLAPGELAVNIADMKLYCENSSGVVTLLADAAANGTVTSVNVSGGTTGLTTSGGPVTGSGTITIAGTLAVANGGTGITSLGTGVATFLGTPSSANLAAAVTDGIGSGSLVFATSPTLVTPVLGTPTSGTLSNCTVDGTNKIGYQNIPLSGIKTASYILVAGDVGKFVELGTSGTIVIPAAVFAAGDAISVFNNTSATIACTCSAITTVYKGGANTNISATGFSITTRGVATILFIATTTVVITGNLA
jgi:hypothetical protein